LPEGAEPRGFFANKFHGSRKSWGPESPDQAFFEQKMNKKNILITGLPGVGKTTLIRKLVEELNQFRPVGFYTEEIREEGTRKGFELISLDGRKGLLSHTDTQSPHRVGKYKVDVKGFQAFLGSIPFLNRSTRLIVIDEIGKMECFSDQFKNLLKEILDSEKWVVATIALKGSAFIEEVKRRHDIALFEITKSNRNLLLSDILREAIPH
jgi:nucleoside-triphosphatase